MVASVTAREYHERTKHRAAGYARGPETIDWTEPPNPFRTFAGAARFELPLSADIWRTSFDALGRFEAPPSALSLESLGALFQLTFAISAWKRQGPDQWALRCVPSSGNLHPTEAYLVARGTGELGDGLYHYDACEHALEQRRSDRGLVTSPCVFVGMSSLHWREAWKYGERAFRYCQLDLGHALAGLHYAAAVLGWRVRPLWSLSSDQVASYLGLDRSEDFANVEREEPALIAWIDTRATPQGDLGFEPERVLGSSTEASWAGRANRIDPHPMYRWPVIDEVALHTRKSSTEPAVPEASAGAERERSLRGERLSAPHLSAADVLRARRSAQRFDARHVLPAAPAVRMLQSLLAGSPCADSFPVPRLHVAALVQRVDGLATGLYALPRSHRGESLMREQFDARFAWEPLAALEPSLFTLADGVFAGAGRQLCCGQAIASDCNLLFVLLGEFDDAVEQTPYAYRQLHMEAGLLAHILYLEAQACGLAGTGIGCFFDDDWHRFLGLASSRLQALYCFSVGRPLLDSRIQTMPPYPQRTGVPVGNELGQRGVTP
ncbi:MAG TPA: nitroreductase family protein [Polyangiales bacterium]